MKEILETLKTRREEFSGLSPAATAGYIVFQSESPRLVLQRDGSFRLTDTDTSGCHIFASREVAQKVATKPFEFPLSALSIAAWREVIVAELNAMIEVFEKVGK